MTVNIEAADQTATLTIHSTFTAPPPLAAPPVLAQPAFTA